MNIYLYGQNCCSDSLASVFGGCYDAHQYGLERLVDKPDLADVLLVTGVVRENEVPVLRTIYEQILEPKVVIALGACSLSGGVFGKFSEWQKKIPVTLNLAGCPPRPEAILDSLMQIESIDLGSLDKVKDVTI